MNNGLVHAMTPKILACIAAGGAVGAVGRYVVSSHVSGLFGTHFPFGTLAVNIIGTLILGILVAVAGETWSQTPALRAFLVVGVLGAFTTFSLFSHELFVFVERGDYGIAAFYATSSVLSCLLGFYIGHVVSRQFLG